MLDFKPFVLYVSSLIVSSGAAIVAMRLLEFMKVKSDSRGHRRRVSSDAETSQK